MKIGILKCNRKFNNHGNSCFQDSIKELFRNPVLVAAPGDVVGTYDLFLSALFRYTVSDRSRISTIMSEVKGQLSQYCLEVELLDRWNSGIILWAESRQV